MRAIIIAKIFSNENPGLVTNPYGNRFYRL